MIESILTIIFITTVGITGLYGLLSGYSLAMDYRRKPGAASTADIHSTEALYHRGRLLQEHGQKELALHDFTRVLELNPEHTGARQARRSLLDQNSLPPSPFETGTKISANLDISPAKESAPGPAVKPPARKKIILYKQDRLKSMQRQASGTTEPKAVTGKDSFFSDTALAGGMTVIDDDSGLTDLPKTDAPGPVHDQQPEVAVSDQVVTEFVDEDELAALAASLGEVDLVTETDDEVPAEPEKPTFTWEIEPKAAPPEPEETFAPPADVPDESPVEPDFSLKTSEFDEDEGFTATFGVDETEPAGTGEDAFEPGPIPEKIASPIHPQSSAEQEYTIADAGSNAEIPAISPPEEPGVEIIADATVTTDTVDETVAAVKPSLPQKHPQAVPTGIDAADIETILATQPTDAEGFNRRGEALVANNQFDEALADFNRAIELNNAFDDAYLNRGKVYATLGEQNKALDDFNMFTNVKTELPESDEASMDCVFDAEFCQELATMLAEIGVAEAYNKRGEEYIRKNLFSRAIDDFNKAILKNPGFSLAYVNRAKALLQRGMVDLALDDLNYACSLAPTDENILNTRGEAYFQKSLLKEAMADFTAAIEINPEFSDAYLNRGRVYSELGNTEKSLEDFNQAVRTEPRQFYTYIDTGAIDHDLLGEETVTLSATRADAASVYNYKYDLVIEFRDGRVEEATFGALFNPADNELAAIPVSTLEPLTFQLAAIACIKLFAKPKLDIIFSSHDLIEDIELVSRTSYRVQIPTDQQFETGFFGRVTDKSEPYQYIFFPYAGIRMRRLLRMLGEILLEKDLLESKTLESVLEEQHRLKQCRLGDIIAAELGLNHADIDQAIEKFNRTQPAGHQKRIGEILLESGLITSADLEKVLKTQEENRKKRIGTMLVERGLVKEEDVLAALAIKNCMRFIDLEFTTIKPDALQALPRQQALKLQVLPIEHRNGKLVVAVRNPEDPAVGDALRNRFKQGVELVVALPAQIAEAIGTYYPPKSNVD